MVWDGPVGRYGTRGWEGWRQLLYHWEVGVAGGAGTGVREERCRKPLARRSPAPGGETGEGEGEGEGYLEAALEALGRRVEVAPPGNGASGGDGGRLVVVPGVGSFPGVLDAATRGDTVVVEAGAPIAGGAPGIWDPAGGISPGPGSSTLLAGEVRVPGALLHPGAPVPGARIPLTGADGRPAAAALPLGQGCLVVAGFRLEGGGLPLQPAFPRLLEELAGACRPAAAGSGALDRGALELIQGVDLPRRVGLEGLSSQAGIDLTRWFLLAALLLAILETFLGYRKP